MNYKLHTPVGLKDFLPEEQSYKKAVEQRIENVFLKYGFVSVSSPTFEFIEVFEDNSHINKTFKFLDMDGSVLGLRPDMTPPIARIVATNYSKDLIPHRLCYLENSFRFNENLQGKRREFTQAGVELIGIDSYEADAEILVVAINSLLNTGLDNFKISLGQVQFINGILEEADLKQEDLLKIRSLILKKDFVSLDNFIETLVISGDIKYILKSLQFLNGDIKTLDEVYNKVNNKKSKDALKRLKNIYYILKDYGFEKYLSFDLGTIGALDYYTGIIFSAYTYGTGFSIIDGGRYDNLLNKFGINLPAVGFAIKINDLADSLSNQNIKFEMSKVETLVVYSKESRKKALQISDELRSQGIIIENSLLGSDIGVNKKYAKSKDINGILYFLDDKKVSVINLIDNTEIIVSIDELVSE